MKNVTTMSHYWKTLPVMADFYSWPNYRTLLNGTQVNADFFVKQSHSQAINWAQ
jgi:hypothetical protein